MSHHCTCCPIRAATQKQPKVITQHNARFGATDTGNGGGTFSFTTPVHTTSAPSATNTSLLYYLHVLSVAYDYCSRSEIICTAATRQTPRSSTFLITYHIISYRPRCLVCIDVEVPFVASLAFAEACSTRKTESYDDARGRPERGPLAMPIDHECHAVRSCALRAPFLRTHPSTQHHDGRPFWQWVFGRRNGRKAP